MSASQTTSAESAGGEAEQLLARLIQFDTVNPPGNERAAQEYLADHLTRAGFHCELLGAEPERPNLVARLRPADGPPPDEPANDGPTLCYLGHVDTVLADAREWTHDPWSGDVADGFLWGRGALDMKSQGAAEIAAGAALARSGWRPARGELLIVSVVDEETGGSLGAEWICKNHPEKVRCDLLLNEGGGEVFEYRGKRYYGVCCAEKGVFRFTVITDGVAGHASMPAIGENALLKLAPVLERLARRQPAYRLTAGEILTTQIPIYSRDNPMTRAMTAPAVLSMARGIDITAKQGDKMPDGLVFDLTHTGWRGAVKEVVPAESENIPAE